VILGNVQQTSKDAIYGARHVGLKAGIPIDRPALTVNRLCGSGFQAVISAAEQILLGEAKAVVAAGSENMSQAPHAVWGLRDGGAKFGKPPEMVDTLFAALHDTFAGSPMGMTAEKLGAQYGITREQCDALAMRSQQRWAACWEAGGFKDEIAPVEIQERKGVKVVDKDEHPRISTMEQLAKLPSVFKKDGLVTAANASGINDGAATLIVVDGEWAKSRGLTPLAKLVSWGVGRRRPDDHGHRPRARDPQRARSRGPQAGRDRSLRRERGLRGAVPRRGEGARPRSRQDERQRRRDRARSPARRERRTHHGEPRLHAAPP
jgi:acetyl-CoA acyltransferase 2